MRTTNLPRVSRSYLAAGAILLVGMGLSALVAIEASKVEDRQVGEILDRDTELQFEEFKLKLADSTVPVEALADFISTQVVLEPGEFHEFAQAARGDDPIARLTWTPIVQDADRAQFETVGRNGNASDYEIRELAAGGGLSRAAQRDAYAPILFEDRFLGAVTALGYDLLSEATRRTAALTACETGEAVATRPSTGVTTKSGPNTQFGLYWPVYPHGRTPATPDERRAQCRGLATGLFPLDQLMRVVFGDTRSLAATISVFVGKTTPDQSQVPTIIYRPGSGQTEFGSQPIGAPPEGGLRFARDVKHVGRTWLFEFDYPPATVSGLRNSAGWVPAVVGCLLTLLLTAYVATQGRRRALIEAEVVDRTAILTRTLEKLTTEIEERGRAEHAQRETLIRLNAVVDSAADGIIISDGAGTALTFNPAAERLFGYAAAEIIGLNIKMLMPAPYAGGHDRYLENYRETGTRKIIGIGREVVGLRKDGTTFPMHLSIGEAKQGDGPIYVGVVHDLTASRAVDASLREMQMLLAGIVSSSDDAMISKTLNGIVTTWNRSAELIFGYSAEEMIGQPISKLGVPGHEDDIEKVLGRIRRGERVDHYETQRRRKDGAILDISLTVSPIRDADGNIIGASKIARDVTATRAVEEQQRQLSAQLQQAQKMEAIGQLTGGMAHDFNNLLGIVIGNLDLLAEQFEPGREERELTDAAIQAAVRGAELTRQLLAFSRRQPLAPKLTYLPPVLDSMAQLLRRTLGEAITLELRVSDDLWPLLIDVSQLESALLNLSVNARDAMRGGGRLVIEATNAEIDENAFDRNVEATPGDYVAIAVSDTGAGISPEVLARVFEPFFTTKGAQGTGLGLSMVHGFIKQSGGYTKIYSEPGHGTTVRLYLPRAPDGEVEQIENGSAASLARGTEVILVVEDNNGLRDVAVRHLHSLGYSTIPASDGAAALEIIRGGTAIDLLFTDVVMPGGMDGRKLSDTARRLRPGLKVLFTSGFTAAAASAVTENHFTSNLLSKPYRKGELARRIRAALDTPEQ